MHNQKLGVIQRAISFFWKKETREHSSINGFAGQGVFGGTATESGENVSSFRGSKISTVFTCVNTIAQSIASLPINVKKESNGIVSNQGMNPVSIVLKRRPNSKMTPYALKYSNVFNMLTYGESFNLIIRNSRMEVIELLPLMPYDVEIQEIDGFVMYLHKGSVYAESEILHYKMYTRDGVRGISPITWNAELMGVKLKLEKYGARAIAQKPAGYLSAENATDPQIQSIGQNWNAAINGENINGTPFLTGGAKYNPLMITPNEAQYLETRILTNTEIYGIYRLPPVFAQNYKDSTYANAEQSDTILVKHTLAPILTLIEEENNNKLFSEANKAASNPFFTKFNINAILRGDTKTRREWYQTMLTSGVLSANEVRDIEDMPPQSDGVGDDYYIQGAMVRKQDVQNNKENGTER